MTHNYSHNDISIEIKDGIQPLIYDLIKKGYGSYQEILEIPFDVFLDMTDYEEFLKDYENECIEISRSK